MSTSIILRFCLSEQEIRWTRDTLRNGVLLSGSIFSILNLSSNSYLSIVVVELNQINNTELYEYYHSLCKYARFQCVSVFVSIFLSVLLSFLSLQYPFFVYIHLIQIIYKQMKLTKQTPKSPSQRSKGLGLSSSRFYQNHMSKHAQEQLEYIKRKDRSNLKIDQWKRNNYYKTDAIKQLFQCPDSIDRRDINDLTVEQFIEKYQKNNKAVIIKGCTRNWNVEKKWNHEYFYKNFKDFKFKVGEDDKGRKLRVQFKYYLQYLVYNKDDSPLYLFQSSLEDKQETRKLINNYTVPQYFKDDLFKYAGDKQRPPYRWFIMGPERSGTTVHIDPLMTSAWNASLAGHKRWVLFSADVPKSIVKGKEFRDKYYEDQAISYFTQILPKIKQKYSKQQLQITEFIQYPGETVFVPGGLWHAVINLDDTIAVTQNVMTHNCFDKVWKATRCQRRKFAQFFLKRLQERDSVLYQRAKQLNEEDGYQMGEKYARQEVSLSFTPTSSSSSSSSSSYSESSSKSKGKMRQSEQKNRVQVKKGRDMSRERSFSRSRDKKRSVYSVDTKSKKRSTDV